jgi:hypothetical protein
MLCRLILIIKSEVPAKQILSSNFFLVCGLLAYICVWECVCLVFVREKCYIFL